MKIAAGNEVRCMAATNDATGQAAKGQVVLGQRRVQRALLRGAHRHGRGSPVDTLVGKLE